MQDKGTTFTILFGLSVLGLASGLTVYTPPEFAGMTAGRTFGWLAAIGVLLLARRATRNARPSAADIVMRSRGLPNVAKVAISVPLLFLVASSSAGVGHALQHGRFVGVVAALVALAFVSALLAIALFAVRTIDVSAVQRRVALRWGSPWTVMQRGWSLDDFDDVTVAFRRVGYNWRPSYNVVLIPKGAGAALVVSEAHATLADAEATVRVFEKILHGERAAERAA